MLPVTYLQQNPHSVFLSLIFASFNISELAQIPTVNFLNSLNLILQSSAPIKMSHGDFTAAAS